MNIGFAKESLKSGSNKPIYLQLVSLIKNMISQKELRSGDLLPSEHELCDIFGISRTTVRLAMQTLAKEHLVERIKGKGTFISSPMFSRTLNNLYSFSGEMQRLNIDSDSQVISFRKVDMPQEFMEHFSGHSGKKLFRIKRIRSVNGTPLTIETVYIPTFICPGLNAELIKNTSLYFILNKLSDITPVKAKETYTASSISKEEASLLKVPTSTSVFRVKRISYDLNIGVFEIAFIVVRGDKCSYEVELKSDHISFSRQVD